MSTTMGFLIAVAAIAVVVSIVRWQMRARGRAVRTRSRTQFLQREKERDRLACLAAARSLDPGPAESGRTGAPVVSGSRRSSGSTGFDPDLPGA